MNNVAKLLALVANTPEWEPRNQKRAAEGSSTSTPSEKKVSQATRLVNLADDFELFHHGDDGYARIQVNGHWEVLPLRSSVFKRSLRQRYFTACGGAPSGQAVQDAVGVLEGSALFQGEERTVHTRIAGYDGRIYLDLCSPDWQVIEVSSSGYKVLRQSPVMFRRSRAMQALPLPVRDGSIDDLRPFLNLAGDDDWRLVTGWLIAGFRPTGPYSVLTLYGEHGSAKSTTARVLRALIDPNDAPLRTTPRDARDLMITATNGHVVAFDNLSRIEPWLSDAICRLATGGGLSTRTLYTDAEEYIFEAQRPVLINGIDDLATRADLLDRSLVVSLPRIADENRRSEHDFWRDFEQTKPSILGALLAVVAAALHNLPETKLPELPRMADFALWVSAAEPAFGWKEGSFMAAYTGNRADANDTALEASPIVTPLRALLEHKDTWEGTPTELLAALEEHASEKVKEGRSWPRSPRALSSALNRIAPNLRASGIAIERDRRHHGRKITITHEKSQDSSDTTDTSDTDGNNPPHRRDANELSVTQDGVPASQNGRNHQAPNSAQIQQFQTLGVGGDGRDAKIPALSPSDLDGLGDGDEWVVS